jgi:hypothetical protein
MPTESIATATTKPSLKTDICTTTKSAEKLYAGDVGNASAAAVGVTLQEGSEPGPTYRLVIASEAKQSMVPHEERWIASSLRSSQ